MSRTKSRNPICKKCSQPQSRDHLGRPVCKPCKAEWQRKKRGTSPRMKPQPVVRENRKCIVCQEEILYDPTRPCVRTCDPPKQCRHQRILMRKRKNGNDHYRLTEKVERQERIKAEEMRDMRLAQIGRYGFGSLGSGGSVVLPAGYSIPRPGPVRVLVKNGKPVSEVIAV